MTIEARTPPASTTTRNAGAEDVRRRLEHAGAGPWLVQRVIGAIEKSGVAGAYAIDLAARAIARLVPIHRSPKRTRGALVLAFVGPTGAGKTTTVAKVGTSLARAGRRVVFASIDPGSTADLAKVGSAESDGDRFEIPVVSAPTPAALQKLLARSRRADVVLLDTPGLPPNDAARVDELARMLALAAGGATLETWVVLPATASERSLDATVAAFARTSPSAVVVTKLDETDAPAPALERAARARWPIAFLCDGQDSRGHLRRPSADRVADLCLSGRIRR